MSQIDFDTSYAAQVARRELSVDGISQEELGWLVAMKGNTDQVGSLDAQVCLWFNSLRLPLILKNSIEGYAL